MTPEELAAILDAIPVVIALLGVIAVMLAIIAGCTVIKAVF